MSRLNQLSNTLAQLASQAELVDHKRGEHYQPLFDEHLFQCKSHLLLPCVHEIQATLTTLINEEQSGKLTTSSAQYLTERLLTQISAIQRELATLNIRHSEAKRNQEFRKPIHRLYQELAQHQNWEYRLMDMVSDKEQMLHSAPLNQQPAAYQDLMITKQRLQRCRDAKVKLEKQIAFRERQK